MRPKKNKKVLFIKSPTPAWIDIASDLKERFGFEPVMWISGNKKHHGQCLDIFPDTQFLDHADAMRALSPFVNFLSERCVDGNFLAANARHEDTFLNMMDRWMGNPDEVSIEKRRAYYIDMANFWFSLIEKLDLDMIVVPTIPHRLYDFMGCVVARYLGVPFIMMEITNEIHILEDGSRKSTYYLLDDLDDRSKIIARQVKTDAIPSPALQRYLDLTLKDYTQAQPLYFKSKNTRQPTLRERAESFYRSIPLFLRAPLNVLRHFAKFRSFRNSKLIFPYLKKQGNPVHFQDIISGFIKAEGVKKNVRAAQRWYQEHAGDPDFSKPYIYFAASFQPERTSTPDAGLYQWTELMLEVISAALPEGWVIYFKEHPSNFRDPIMSDNIRNIAFYERIKTMAPRLSFIKMDVDPFALIDNSKAVATSTGTSALQAITRGIPAMLFGEVWFSCCSEVSRIRSLEDCQRFIQNIISGYRPRREAVQQYLCATENVGGSFGWSRGFEPYDREANKESLRQFTNMVNALYVSVSEMTESPQERLRHAG